MLPMSPVSTVTYVSGMDRLLLARSERFELPTLGIEIRCSIQLSYEREGSRISELSGSFQRAMAFGRIPSDAEFLFAHDFRTCLRPAGASSYTISSCEGFALAENQRPICANTALRVRIMRQPIKSEAGMAAVILAEISGRALIAKIGRRAVVIGEGAGHKTRAVVVKIADRVR